jgi:low temperature requirement protein LtrA
VIVAIGESVVAIGIGADGLAVDLGLVAVAVLGLGLSACLWWTYFGGDDERAERALADAPAEVRPRMAIDGFGYCHLLLLLGVIATAAGLKATIAHPFDELHAKEAVQLAGGAALFLAGDVLFRRALRLEQGPWRLLGAAAVALTIPIGLEVSAAVQLLVVVALMGAALAVDGTRTVR